jgi:type VI secretion system protein ImpH
VALEQILEDFFKFRARIYPFQGHFKGVDPEDWTTLGVFNSKNTVLGQNAMLGQQTWIISDHIIVELGPLSQEDILPFLGNGPAYGHLKLFIHLYYGKTQTFDLHLLCHPTKPLESGLNQKSQLGWTSFAGKREQDERIIVHG